MPILFDHDPITGVTQYFDYDPITDKVHITSTQDIAKVFDANLALRNDPENWKRGVKEGFAHYATIPPLVELELRKKGLRLGDQNATKRIIQEIETNYPYCKVTDAKHG